MSQIKHLSDKAIEENKTAAERAANKQDIAVSYVTGHSIEKDKYGRESVITHIALAMPK
jgi:hypothetical protein